ncbi:MAG: chemotaxis protein CheW [Gammaproteobacteria bacterium]|nr:chemotaxis protein CheW [Gammaproteobacteria bacterium]
MSETEIPVKASCWSTIGVWGNRAQRCEKLKDVIHCRNCSTYWDAGRQVLEKRIPDGYIEQWTRVISANPEPVSKTSRSIIYFRIGEEWFSLSTRNFIEVSQLKSVHNIPHRSRNLIIGVINIGGSVRLCFSLGFLLGVTQTDEHKRVGPRGIYKRYLVVQIDKKDYVFPVDEVGGVHRYDPEDLIQVPATVEAEKAQLLLGILDIDGKNVACIDAYRLAHAFEAMLGE